MKKKKIIIFTLVLIGIVMIAIAFIRSMFVTNGQILEDIVYKSDNLIIHVAKEGTSKRLVVLGSGYSLSINEQNQIVNHDPFMVLPNMEGYSDETTVMSIFYPFECSGLEESGKEISNFINSKSKEYDEIILIGHSKCGVCFANAAKWIEPSVTIVTVSAPFSGTPAADEKAVSKNLNLLEEKAYFLIFSNHNVDQDIMPDSEFIENANYSGLQKHHHINIISTCPRKSLNLIDLLLIHIDKKFIDGDGIVPTKSQELIFEDTITKNIEATHATSLQEAIKIIKEYVPDL